MIATDYIFARKETTETKLFLFDTYPTLGAAWFPFRIKSDYNKCLRIRRSSDDAETDVLTDANPAISVSLDSLTAAGVSLGDWIGANDGFVKIAYDMTGNGFDFIQTTPVFQPKFISGGNIILDPLTNDPAMYSTGNHEYLNAISTSFPATGDITFSVFSKFRQRSLSSGNGMIGVLPSENPNLGRRMIGIGNDPDPSIRYYGGNAVWESDFIPPYTVLRTVIKNPSATPAYWENGIVIPLKSQGANHTLAVPSHSAFRLFSVYSNAFPNYNTTAAVEGFISGCIWYLSDQSANREEIESIIGI